MIVVAIDPFINLRFAFFFFDETFVDAFVYAQLLWKGCATLERRLQTCRPAGEHCCEMLRCACNRFPIPKLDLIKV